MVRTENEQDLIKVNGKLANFLFSFLEIVRSALGNNWGGIFNSEREKRRLVANGFSPFWKKY